MKTILITKDDIRIIREMALTNLLNDANKTEDLITRSWIKAILMKIGIEFKFDDREYQEPLE